jgi:hypothetical protein
MSKEAELYAEEHQIRLLYLPANLTHIMQVSDLAVFALLKRKFYKIEREHSLAINGKPYTKATFWTLLRPAWDAATTENNVRRGFEMSGQWPIDMRRPLRAIESLHMNESSPPLPVEYDQDLRLRTLGAQYERTVQQLSAERKRTRELSNELEAMKQASDSSPSNCEMKLGSNSPSRPRPIHGKHFLTFTPMRAQRLLLCRVRSTFDARTCRILMSSSLMLTPQQHWQISKRMHRRQERTQHLHRRRSSNWKGLMLS